MLFYLGGPHYCGICLFFYGFAIIKLRKPKYGDCLNFCYLYMYLNKMKFYLLSHIHTQTNHNILLISSHIHAQTNYNILLISKDDFIRVFPSRVKSHTLVIFSVAVSRFYILLYCLFWRGGGLVIFLVGQYVSK